MAPPDLGQVDLPHCTSHHKVVDKSPASSQRQSNQRQHRSGASFGGKQGPSASWQIYAQENPGYSEYRAKDGPLLTLDAKALVPGAGLLSSLPSLCRLVDIQVIPYPQTKVPREVGMGLYSNIFSLPGAGPLLCQSSQLLWMPARNAVDSKRKPSNVQTANFGSLVVGNVKWLSVGKEGESPNGVAHGGVLTVLAAGKQQAAGTETRGVSSQPRPSLTSSTTKSHLPWQRVAKQPHLMFSLTDYGYYALN